MTSNRQSEIFLQRSNRILVLMQFWSVRRSVRSSINMSLMSLTFGNIKNKAYVLHQLSNNFFTHDILHIPKRKCNGRNEYLEIVKTKIVSEIDYEELNFSFWWTAEVIKLGTSMLTSNIVYWLKRFPMLTISFSCTPSRIVFNMSWKISRFILLLFHSVLAQHEERSQLLQDWICSFPLQLLSFMWMVERKLVTISKTITMKHFQHSFQSHSLSRDTNFEHTLIIDF